MWLWWGVCSASASRRWSSTLPLTIGWTSCGARRTPTGSQAVVVSIDARKKLFRGYEVVVASGTRRTSQDPVEATIAAQRAGAGEFVLTAIDREGTWTGIDVDLTSSVTRRVTVPVIANGGAGTVEHIGDAIHRGGASGVAVGSMVVFQGKDLGVLVSFPEPAELTRVLRR